MNWKSVKLADFADEQLFELQQRADYCSNRAEIDVLTMARIGRRNQRRL